MGLILTLLVHFKTKAVVARQSWGFQLMSSGWEDTPDLGKAIQCFPAAMFSGEESELVAMVHMGG